MFIFSNKCFACSKAINSKKKISLCSNCYVALSWSDNISQTLCSSCGEVVSGNISSEKISCGKCIANPFAFDQMHFVMQYDLITGFLLKSYKFNKKFCYARLLIKLIQIWIIKQENLFDKNNYNIDLIIPMPLHRVKLIH